jgi:PKD repeat protein
MIFGISIFYLTVYYFRITHQNNLNMRTFTLLIAFSLSSLLLPLISNSQQVEKEKPGRSSINIRFLDEVTGDGDIVAAFSVDIRYGFPPLTVSFTDQSGGEIESWNWSFGDGQTSEEQNPLHTYLEPAYYSVALTVSDGNNYYTLEKENFIKVMEATGDCDTLDYPFGGTYTYYVLQSPAQGYVSGTNSYGDLAKANLFNTAANSVVTGTFVDFAVAKDISGTNPDITIAIWDIDSNNRPGSIIAYKSIPFNEILDDVANDVASWVLFDDPVSVGEKFFAGAVLPTTNDTLAFWTDTNPESNPGKGWEQWYDQSWHAYSSDQSWGLNISNAIHPVVCQISGVRNNFPQGAIAVYPVPARDKIYIAIADETHTINLIELYDLQGRLIYSARYDNYKTVRSIPVHNLISGLYTIRAVSDNHTLVQKVLISK